MKLALALLIAPLLAGCGGASPEDQVRDTARKGTEALLSDHPESACKYAVDREKCIEGVAELKALGMNVAATAGYPDDWRSRLAKSKITIKGKTATVGDFNGDDKPGRYVLRRGEWLVDNSGD